MQTRLEDYFNLGIFKLFWEFSTTGEIYFSGENPCAGDLLAPFGPKNEKRCVVHIFQIASFFTP